MARRHDELAQLLQTKLEAVRAELLRTGTISKNALDEVEALDKLARLAEKKTSKTRTSGLLLGSALAVALLIVAAVDRETADIDLDLKVRSINFTSRNRQVLLDSLVAGSMGITQVTRVELPASAEAPMDRFESKDGTVTLSVRTTTSATGGVTVNNITVEPVLVAPEAAVQISQERENRSALKVTIQQSDSITLRAAVRGHYQVASSLLRRVGEFKTPVLMETQVQPKTAATLILSGVGNRELGGILAVSSLSFIEPVDVQDGSTTFVRDRGSIRSGRLTFAEFTSRTLELRSGDVISMEATGYLDALRFGDDGIAVHFIGQAKNLRRRLGESNASLMPSWFEWIRERHFVWMLWATGLSAFGSLTLLLNWWRRE
jgi:hypothetical protein